MAKNDNAWKRYVDTGAAFVQLTRERAESIVKELVKAGEVQQERTSKVVEELMARSRKNSEELQKMVRAAVQEQLGALGLATKADIARLEAKINAASKSGASKSGASKKPAAKKAAAKKAPAKKAASA
jgi:polyhydroxyalkanoate synthesis regulator phasin